jgi:L-alanine-DL-glutamate epimerase-like enolase superfamily enzyme
MMNRRSFLKTIGSAGAFLLAGDCAPARSLFVVGVEDSSQISNIEWILYETGRRQADNQPERRCAVRITAASGTQGWADFTGSTMPGRTSIELIRTILLGRSTGEHSAIWRQLYEQGVPLGVLTAVDVALWDLRGRLEGKPVHVLLGTRRQDVPVYASTGFGLGGPEAYAAYAVACKEKGVPACKIQAQVGSLDRDMAVYKAVRDAVGPDYPCLAGGSRAYSFDEALRVGRLLDDLTYKRYESPMPEDDAWRDRYISLAAQVRTPICTPGANPDSYPARVLWIGAKACDIACMDVLHGGLTACIELASACEAAGIRLELPSIGPDSYPHLQLIGATESSLIEYFEFPSPSREPYTLPGRATPEPTCDDQGRVAIPQTPGMGIELDWRYIYTHRVG